MLYTYLAVYLSPMLLIARLAETRGERWVYGGCALTGYAALALSMIHDYLTL